MNWFYITTKRDSPEYVPCPGGKREPVHDGMVIIFPTTRLNGKSSQGYAPRIIGPGEGKETDQNNPKRLSTLTRETIEEATARVLEWADRNGYTLIQAD